MGFGCSKDFLDQSNNPNSPTSMPPDKILPAALVKTSYLLVDGNLEYLNVWMGYWAFSNQYSVNADYRQYKNPNGTSSSGFFTNAYTNAYDYQNIIDLSISSKDSALEGMGRIMKSYVMQMLVDIYNDVPYSEAFKATANQTPKYDKGQAVYEGLYADISLGIRKIKGAQNAGAAFPSASADLLFAGDASKWVRFANTLKLKLLLRQSGVASRKHYIDSCRAADFGGGIASFLQQGDVAQINPGYSNSDSKQNPFWTDYGYGVTGTLSGNLDYFRASKFFVKFCSAENDFRLMHKAQNLKVDPVFTPAFDFLNGKFTLDASLPNVNNVPQDTTYIALLTDGSLGVPINMFFAGTDMSASPSSASGTILPTNFSRIVDTSYGTRQVTDASPLFTDFESLFLQAEAAQRGWFSNDPQELYDSAINQSFLYCLTGNGNLFNNFGVTQYDFVNEWGPNNASGNPNANGSAYFNDWSTTTTTDDRIKLIISQKWVALATINFLEPWAEYRRTGYPDFIPLSKAPGALNHIPYRYMYPQREYDINNRNVPDGATNPNKVSTITTDSKIWWMP